MIIDWKMPDIDGIETARRIRAIVGPEVTIIIITAYDWASIEARGHVGGRQSADEQAHVQVIPGLCLYQGPGREGGAGLPGGRKDGI